VLGVDPTATGVGLLLQHFLLKLQYTNIVKRKFLTGPGRIPVV